MRGWIRCRNQQFFELKHEEQVNTPGCIDYENSYRMKNLSFEIHHIVMSNLDMVTNILEKKHAGLLNLRWGFE